MQGTIRTAKPNSQRTKFTHCKGLLAAQEGAFLIDDRTGHGASDFGERHIQFGTAEYPDWASVVSYFLNKVKWRELEKEEKRLDN